MSRESEISNKSRGSKTETEMSMSNQNSDQGMGDATSSEIRTLNGSCDGGQGKRDIDASNEGQNGVRGHRGENSGRAREPC